jgi:hypothetical protein
VDVLRREIVALLEGQGAHMPFEEAVASFPEEAMNRRPPNVSYTPWHLVEHIRITQWDILEYVRTPGHVSPPWPSGYWPPPSGRATPAQFAASVAGTLADRRALRKIVLDPATDLEAPLVNNRRHTTLREIRIVADHTAYHVGEFAILRQVTGTWPSDHDAPRDE